MISPRPTRWGHNKPSPRGQVKLTEPAHQLPGQASSMGCRASVPGERARHRDHIEQQIGWCHRGTGHAQEAQLHREQEDCAETPTGAVTVAIATPARKPNRMSATAKP